jgi:hypothetical protein
VIFHGVVVRDFLTHAEYSKDNWKNDEWFDSLPEIKRHH